MLSGTLDNLLINGDFLRGLWTRLQKPFEPVECPTWRHTFAADRWYVRYENAAGAAVSQAMSHDLPVDLYADGSLEIRGTDEVTETVYLGQRIEAAESSRYRRRLIFSAWIFQTAANRDGETPALQIRSPQTADLFDGTEALRFSQPLSQLPLNQWIQIEQEFDGREFGSNGIAVELAFPASQLNNSNSVVRVAGLRVIDISHLGREMERPASVERLLAERFFQRHGLTNINSIGRALVINSHELHFQFAFSPMRIPPACTVTQDNDQLCVYSIDGIPQRGFRYDVTYRSHGSVIIRATKAAHGIRDGYLSFIADGGSILLDAEL